MVLTAEQQRAKRSRLNYDRNALGKLVRKKAFRDCDYTPEGHLVQFDDEAGFIAFEEERYTNGQHQAHYSTKVRSTVPAEQLALDYIRTAKAMHNDAAREEGHETRVHLDQTTEGLHERLDQHDAMLREIGAHQRGESQKAKELLEKQLELAEKKKQQNEAFVARVGSGGGTRLEELKLQAKRTQRKIQTIQQTIKQNKVNGLRCAVCGSPEGEMTPYIGNRFLGACCAQLHTTDEELLQELHACATDNFLQASEADEILAFCKDKMPESKRIKLPPYNNESLQSSKIVCADVDDNGWFPQYEFANMTPDNYSLRQSAITGTALQPLCQKLTAVYYAGVEQRFHIVINCHADGTAYTPSHKDQPMTLNSRSDHFETFGAVFVLSVGGDRLFSFFKDLGQKGSAGLKTRGDTEIFYDVKTTHNTLARMSGRMNAACFHALFATTVGEMRFGVTARVTERLFVNSLLGEYKIYKKGQWATRKLNEELPAQTPVDGRAAHLQDDERRRHFENMSKAQLVEFACQAEQQPPRTPGKRGPQGSHSGRAKRPRVGSGQPRAASTSAGAAGHASSMSSPDSAPKGLILSMPGPELVDLMLTKDGKILDNRKWKLPEKRLPCWVYPLVGMKGKKKDWDWRNEKWATEPVASKELAEKLRTLPVKECVGDWYGHVPGALWIKEVRKPEQCNGNEWAFGPNCLVVEKFYRFQTPVPMQKRGGARTWYEMNDEEWEQLKTNIPDAPAVHHNLSVLDGAQATGVPGNSSHMAPVDASGDVGPSDTAARLVAHRPADVASE